MMFSEMPMRRARTFLLILSFLAAAPSCREKAAGPAPAAVAKRQVVGLFQAVDSPTANEVREGILKAFADKGLRDGDNIRLEARSGGGDISEVQRIAQALVEEKVDLLIPISTPCLQAALNATRTIPIVFTSVANPYLIGAGGSPVDHPGHVTGVASTGPIRQTIRFIHEILPKAWRIGTLWTPSELNSEYYLELAQESAAEYGAEVIAMPILNADDVLHAAQVLVNEGIDVIYQISDNTINSAFGVLGRVAEENGIPLFGGFLTSTELGASAAMGFDFFDMGYKTGLLAARILNGESPSAIPFQYMDEIKTYLNLEAARKQGLIFPPGVIAKADKVLGTSSGADGSGTGLN